MTPDAADLAIASKAKAAFDGYSPEVSAELFRLLQSKYGDTIRHGVDGVIRHFDNDKDGALVVTNLLTGLEEKFVRDADQIFRKQL